MKGVILIYSCQKHKNSRLKEFQLSKRDYDGWKVFIILGDLTLDTEYKIEDNIITIKCEDSYFYVLKKVALGMKVIMTLFPTIEGILRCGDDLIFNEEQLQIFLNNQKHDYMGVTWGRNPLKIPLGKHEDNFMWDYYKHHPEDFSNPLHGLPTPDTIKKMNQIPTVVAASGVIIYFSNRACKEIIKHMENINWNILAYTEDYGYPYTIEDNSIGFILHKAGIYPTDYPIYTESIELFKRNKFITLHTNKYK